MEKKKDKKQKNASKVKQDKDQRINRAYIADAVNSIEDLQRLQAEFENYKKRTEKEKLEFIKYAKEEFIKNLLPVLDSFEQALKNKDKQEEFIKGIELIFSQFHSILEQEGLRSITTSNEKFDPYKHEVLLQEKSDTEEGIILEDLQKGYMLNNRVIRHSKVKISKK
tara:strand:+ start:952 stop:1452 length:501 start_codon:yes stop_codon:yes gene_type:complete